MRQCDKREIRQLRKLGVAEDLIRALHPGVDLPKKVGKPRPRRPSPVATSEPGILRFAVYARTRGPNGGGSWRERYPDKKAARESAYIQTIAGGLNSAARVTDPGRDRGCGEC